MKHYTNKSQTAKLIELGFEKPNEIYLSYFDSPKDFKSTNVIEIDEDGNEIVLDNYSIGELIEALDTVNETVHCRFGGVKSNCVSTNSGYEKIGGELIDLLFDLCVKLKEEGVI